MDDLADADRGALADAVDELYAGDPTAFVARRDALVKDARARKDRPLANAIKALRRPTVGAWYVNLAARARLTSLVELLRLGEELREAASGQDFRRVVSLGPERAALERRVLRDLTAHLGALGVTATAPGLEEVRSTLRAALERQDAADAVRAGALDRPLGYGEDSDALIQLATLAGPSTSSGTDSLAEPVEAPPAEPDEAPPEPDEAPLAEPVEAPPAEPVEAPPPEPNAATTEPALLRVEEARAALEAAIAARELAADGLRAAEAQLRAALDEVHDAEELLSALAWKHMPPTVNSLWAQATVEGPGSPDSFGPG